MQYLVEVFATQALEAGLAGPQPTDAALVQSILVPEDETCYLLYEAASAEDVAAAARRAGIAYERIVSAISTRAQGNA